MITNPSSGSNDKEAIDAALEVLRSGGEVVCDVVETTCPDDLDQALADLGDRDVVVAGGDGSLHAVVNALSRLDLLGSTRMGVIPLGTGNDFARGIGIPLEPDQAAQLIVAGHTQATDLIVDDTGLVVLNNVHLGIGAQASRAAVKWKARLGRFGYLVGAIGAGLRPDFIRVNVTVDGEDLMPGGRVAQVAIGNGPHVGGGTELIPGADPTSGHMLVIVSRTVGPLSRLVYVARLKGGSHHLMKEVSRKHASVVTVEGDRFWLTADGELSGPNRARRWELKRGALEVFAPRVRHSSVA
jgi:YegS/Rv2252/BmrU family lipid kinase